MARKKRRRVFSPTPRNGRTIDLPNHTSTRIVVFANRMSRAGSRFYRDRYGIGIVEWRILLCLGHASETSANRICRDADLDKGAASRSLNALARMGLVRTEEDGTDSRRRKIALTSKGHALHDRIVPVALARQRSLLAALTPAEVSKFEEMLGRLMKRVPGGATPQESGTSADRRGPMTRREKPARKTQRRKPPGRRAASRAQEGRR